MKANIKFYVLVPVYNVEKYVKASIQSVLNQTYNEYEIVLVNDGSTDESGQICDWFSQKYNNIHVIHQQNQGAFATRRIAENYVLKHLDTNGAYIVYLDSDDTLEKTALQDVADVIEANNGVDVVVYNLRRISTKGEIWLEDLNDGSIEVLEDKRELYKKVLMNQSYNSLCRKAVSVKLLAGTENTNMHKIFLGEDLVASLHYYRMCKKVVFLNKILYNYLTNPKSITHNVNEVNFPTDDVSRKIAWDFIKEENCFTSKEKTEYQRYVQELLRMRIKQVCYLETNLLRKRELLNIIRKHEIWNECLRYNIKGIVLVFFRLRMMNTILAIYSVRRLFARAKRYLCTKK